MTTFEQQVRRYLDAWNETDAAARERAVQDVFAADARYVDPMAQAQGRSEIAATIGAVQQQFAGLEFSLVGAVDGHGDQVRFQWGLGPAGAEPVAIGFDVAVRDADGRFALVLGFLDRVPA